jgi:hypothetical protein
LYPDKDKTNADKKDLLIERKILWTKIEDDPFCPRSVTSGNRVGYNILRFEDFLPDPTVKLGRFTKHTLHVRHAGGVPAADVTVE